MLFKIRVNNTSILAKDFIYNIQTNKPNTLTIHGVWYGSKDYKYLQGLLGEPTNIELLDHDDEVFAKLGNAELNNMEYHLLEDDIDIHGVFDYYTEDIRNIGESYE